MTFFSIIMPVTLANYPNSARNKPEKLKRAIDSVMNQTSDDWQLVVIADADQQAYDQVRNGYQNKNILLAMVKKQPKFGGIRNIGVGLATGKYVIYLDADDYYLPNYLEQLQHEIKQETESAWYIVDDMVYQTQTSLIRREAKITHGYCGTANIIHRRQIEARWADKAGYSQDDWLFVQALQKVQQKPVYLKTCGNVVAHIPYKYDY